MTAPIGNASVSWDDLGIRLEVSNDGHNSHAIMDEDGVDRLIEALVIARRLRAQSQRAKAAVRYGHDTYGGAV